MNSIKFTEYFGNKQANIAINFYNKRMIKEGKNPSTIISKVQNRSMSPQNRTYIGPD